MSDGHGKSAYTPYLNTVTFTTAGTWTVPAQVTSIRVKMWGGGGAAATWHAGCGGFVSGYLSVTPGSTLTISAIGAGGTYTTDSTAACSGGSKYWTSGGGGTAVYYTNSIYMIAGGGGGSYGGSQYGPGNGGGGGSLSGGGNGFPYDMQSAGGWGTNTHGRGGAGSNQLGDGSYGVGGAAPPSILVQGYGGVVTQYGLGGAGQSHVNNQFGFVAAGGLPRTTAVCMGPYGYQGVEYVGCGGGGGWAGGGGAGFGGAGGGGSGATSTWTSVTSEASIYTGHPGGENDANYTYPTALQGVGNWYQNSHPAGYAGKVVILY